MIENTYDLNTDNLINDDLENTLHPCKYCKKTCKGKQCKDCHFKMVSSRQGVCLDCDKQFYAVRSDNSKRKRCFECQKNYNSTHIAKCPICNIDYHAYLEDGRFFDKCYGCYKSNIKECEKCKKNTINGFPLCNICYNEEKSSKIKLLSYSPTSSTKSIEYTFKQIDKQCKTDNCNNSTIFTYCEGCYSKNKPGLITSICQICGYKNRGNFKICNKCL